MASISGVGVNAGRGGGAEGGEAGGAWAASPSATAGTTRRNVAAADGRWNTSRKRNMDSPFGSPPRVQARAGQEYRFTPTLARVFRRGRRRKRTGRQDEMGCCAFRILTVL